MSIMKLTILKKSSLIFICLFSALFGMEMEMYKNRIASLLRRRGVAEDHRKELQEFLELDEAKYIKVLQIAASGIKILGPVIAAIPLANSLVKSLQYEEAWNKEVMQKAIIGASGVWLFGHVIQKYANIGKLKLEEKIRRSRNLCQEYEDKWAAAEAAEFAENYREPGLDDEDNFPQFQMQIEGGY